MSYIYILCHNESTLLPHTIAHYKKYLPNCIITIYDNESIDNSVEIATSLGCNVISWNSGNIMDEHKQKDVKNNCWKNIANAWVLVIDMDEWLCVSEKQLQEERESGTTILKTLGINMIGESKSITLDDINLHDIVKGVKWPMESKSLCFYTGDSGIKQINYDLGAHRSSPIGNVKYSENVYVNKHMCYLGLPFIIDKMVKRYERSKKMQSQGLNIHYTGNVSKITDEYNKFLMKVNKS